MNRMSIQDATKEQLIEIVKQQRQQLRQTAPNHAQERIRELEQQVASLQELVQEKNTEISAIRHHNTLLAEKSAGDEETISVLIKQLEEVRATFGETKGPSPTTGALEGAPSSPPLGPTVVGRNVSVGDPPRRGAQRSTSAQGVSLPQSQRTASALAEVASNEAALTAQLAAANAAVASKNDDIAKLESQVRELMEVNTFYSAIVSQHDEEDKVRFASATKETGQGRGGQGPSAAGQDDSVVLMQRIVALEEQRDKLQRVVKQLEKEKSAVEREMTASREKATRLESEILVVEQWQRGLEACGASTLPQRTWEGRPSVIQGTAPSGRLAAPQWREGSQPPTAPAPERIPAQLIAPLPQRQSGVERGRHRALVGSPLASQIAGPPGSTRNSGTRASVDIHALRPIRIRNPDPVEKELMDRIALYENHVAALEAYEADRQASFNEMERSRAELFAHMNEQLEKQRREIQQLRKTYPSPSSTASVPREADEEHQTVPRKEERDGREISAARGVYDSTVEENHFARDTDETAPKTATATASSSPASFARALSDLVQEEAYARAQSELAVATILVDVLTDAWKQNQTDWDAITRSLLQEKERLGTELTKVRQQYEEQTLRCEDQTSKLNEQAAGTVPGPSSGAVATVVANEAVAHLADTALNEKRWSAVDQLIQLHGEDVEVYAALLRSYPFTSGGWDDHEASSLRDEEEYREALTRLELLKKLLQQRTVENVVESRDSHSDAERSTMPPPSTTTPPPSSKAGGTDGDGFAAFSGPGQHADYFYSAGEVHEKEPCQESVASSQSTDNPSLLEDKPAESSPARDGREEASTVSAKGSDDGIPEAVLTTQPQLDFSSHRADTERGSSTASVASGQAEPMNTLKASVPDVGAVVSGENATGAPVRSSPSPKEAPDKIGTGRPATTSPKTCAENENDEGSTKHLKEGESRVSADSGEADDLLDEIHLELYEEEEEQGDGDEPIEISAEEEAELLRQLEATAGLEMGLDVAGAGSVAHSTATSSDSVKSVASSDAVGGNREHIPGDVVNHTSPTVSSPHSTSSRDSTVHSPEDEKENTSASDCSLRDGAGDGQDHMAQTLLDNTDNHPTRGSSPSEDGSSSPPEERQRIPPQSSPYSGVHDADESVEKKESLTASTEVVNEATQPPGAPLPSSWPPFSPSAAQEPPQGLDVKGADDHLAVKSAIRVIAVTGPTTMVGGLKADSSGQPVHSDRAHNATTLPMNTPPKSGGLRALPVKKPQSSEDDEDGFHAEFDPFA